MLQFSTVCVQHSVVFMCTVLIRFIAEEPINGEHIHKAVARQDVLSLESLLEEGYIYSVLIHHNVFKEQRPEMSRGSVVSDNARGATNLVPTKGTKRQMVHLHYWRRTRGRSQTQIPVLYRNRE